MPRAPAISGATGLDLADESQLATRIRATLRETGGVLMPALVQELVRTIRQNAPGQRRDGVDDLPKFPFRIL